MKKIGYILFFLSILIYYTAYGQDDIDTFTTKEFEGKKGKLIIPADKYISFEKCCVEQYYKDNTKAIAEPIKNRLKITCDSSTNVLAAAYGKVSRIVKTDDYYAIIIRHGNYLTVYSSMASVIVSNGELLKEKQILGKVKSKDEQIVLDFEVWFESKKLDPLEWISVK